MPEKASKINYTPELASELVKKLQFKPDVLVRVVGVTMGDSEGRQNVLEKASIFCTPTAIPPINLVREPTNQFDAGAIKVYIGTDISLVNNIKTWEHSFAGYLPKGLEIPVRDTKGTEMLDKDNKPLLFPVWKLLDYINAKQAPGKLLVGVHFIVKAPGTDNYGLELGLRHTI